jgi:hypothetical protein
VDASGEVGVPGDRLLGEVPQLQVLRAALGAEPVAQLGSCGTSTAADIALHVDLWLVDRRRHALRWIHDAGSTDLALDDLDLVGELLLAACERS